MSAEALHASAPEGCGCADCAMDREPCPTCYAAWWAKRHPNVTQHGGEARVEPIAGPSSEPAKQDKAILSAASALSAPVEAVEVLTAIVEATKDGFIQVDHASRLVGTTAEFNAALDRARTLVAQPLQAVQEVRMLRKLTPDDARQLLCVRDYLDAGKINDAVYALTAFADPEMGQENPWKDIEQLAAISATTKEN